MNYRKISIIMLVALLGTGLALVSLRTKAQSKVSGQSLVEAQSGRATNGDQKQFRAGMLIPEAQSAFKALGDRLAQPGKERVVLSGVLQTSEARQQVPVTLISELPRRLRLTMQEGAGQRSLVFDGQGAMSTAGSLSQSDVVMLETLVYDTAESFFLGQMQDNDARFLGSNFRLHDGSAADYSGPLYAIYQVTENIKTDNSPHRQSKFYYFNSSTHLLELVRYTEKRGGTNIEVEIQIGDWQSDQQQQVARRITRLENKAPVLRLILESAQFVPQAEDGAFSVR